MERRIIQRRANSSDGLARAKACQSSHGCDPRTLACGLAKLNLIVIDPAEVDDSYQNSEEDQKHKERHLRQLPDNHHLTSHFVRRGFEEMTTPSLTLERPFTDARLTNARLTNGPKALTPAMITRAMRATTSPCSTAIATLS